MIEFIETRDGCASVSVDSVLLYSRYSPKKQIHRFLLDEDLSDCDLLYIVSDGLGILESMVRELAPHVSPVSIVLSPDIHALSEAHFEHPTWVYGNNTPLVPFLRKHTTGVKSGVGRILVWEPAARMFVHAFRTVKPMIESHLRREAHSQLTTRTFGPRWLRNILRNTRSVPSSVIIDSLTKTSRPVVLLIPGPNAEQCLDLIAEFRERVVLITVSSALSTLQASRLVPDLVVHTDPGFYSSLHFPPGLPPGAAVLCMPLTAGSPGLRFHSWFPFSNGLLAESDALAELGIPERIIPEAGTVTATALRIADTIRTGSLYVCGLDLCFRDVRSHARGHGFEQWIHSRTNRFGPVEGNYLSRAADTIPGAKGCRYAANLNVYASWIRDYVAGKEAVFRVNASPVDLGMVRLNVREFRLHLEQSAGATCDAAYTASLQQANRLFPEHASRRLLERWKELLNEHSPSSELSLELRQLLGTRGLT